MAHVDLHPNCIVEATYHIGHCARSKFVHNQFSRSKYIEVGCARAHVHSDTLWACRSHIPTGRYLHAKYQLNRFSRSRDI